MNWILLSTETFGTVRACEVLAGRVTSHWRQVVMHRAMGAEVVEGRIHVWQALRIVARDQTVHLTHGASLSRHSVPHRWKWTI